MEITYRTKDDAYSMGIQVDYKEDEDIQPLINELAEKGFEHKPCNIPISFKKNVCKTSYFYRNGSGLFGLKTVGEINAFINDSKPILKKYFKKLKMQLYYYDND